MIISLGNSRERLPIIIIDCYVIITIFLYYFGPVEFKSPYSPYMVLYLLLFLVIINVSYFRAIWIFNNDEMRSFNQITAETGLNPLPIWFYFLGVIIPFIMVISAVIITGFSGFDGSLFNAMAKAYTFTQSGGKFQEGIDMPMWIYMHFAVFVYLTIFDGALFGRKNNKTRKILWILSLLLVLTYFILFRGAQKTLGDIFVLCSSAVVIKVAWSGNNKISKKRLLFLCFFTISFGIVLSSVMGARQSLLNEIGYQGAGLSNQFWEYDLTNPLVSILPYENALGVATMTFYLCNGLCGLSYCLPCPFTWTYGLTTFPDLSDILGRRLGIDAYENTYMYEAYQIYGWHHSEQWHSLFPYLASDWTFIGALVIMAGVAYVYAICWMEILRKNNKESIYMFSLLNIIWVYLPCNNQIFATRTTALVFVICIFMWIRRKKHASKR